MYQTFGDELRISGFWKHHMNNTVGIIEKDEYIYVMFSILVVIRSILQLLQLLPTPPEDFIIASLCWCCPFGTRCSVLVWTYPRRHPCRCHHSLTDSLDCHATWTPNVGEGCEQPWTLIFGWGFVRWWPWSTCQILSKRSLRSLGSLPVVERTTFSLLLRKVNPKRNFSTNVTHITFAAISPGCFELLLSEVWTLVEGKLSTAQWSHGWWLLAIPALYGAVDAAGPGQWGNHGEGGNASFDRCWWGLFHSVLWAHGQKRISNQ